MTNQLDMRPSSNDLPQPLRTTLVQNGDSVVVTASGELDLMHSGALLTELFGLIESFRRVVLDLRDVGFIDSSGLHCLLDVDAASRAAGVEFAMIRGPRHVQRLFTITKTEDRLRFVDEADPLV
jgi:anti-anti-sigma factor